MPFRLLAKLRVLAAAGLLLGLTALTHAAVPNLVRYQGFLKDNQDVPLEGPYQITFRLYPTETGSAAIWTETQSNVAITTGSFSVLLGQVTALDSVDWSGPLWLSIQVNADTELVPRQQITSVPLALRAAKAEQLTNPVTTSNITDDANRLVPSGVVSFFDLPACPAGWTEMTVMRGRYLIGLPAGGQLGATVGTALSAGENRPAGKHGHGASDPGHSHTYPLSVPGYQSSAGWHFSQWAANDTNWTPQRDISRETTGITVQDFPGVPGTNAPYLQLLVCRKN